MELGSLFSIFRGYNAQYTRFTKGPCIVFVGCTCHCDQTNAHTDIFFGTIGNLESGLLIGTNWTPACALVWPEKKDKHRCRFRVKYTVQGRTLFIFSGEREWMQNVRQMHMNGFR